MALLNHNNRHAVLVKMDTLTHILKGFLLQVPEAYLRTYQIYSMEFFAEIIYGFYPLTTFAKKRFQ